MISSRRSRTHFDAIHLEPRASLFEIDGARVIVQQVANGARRYRRGRGKGAELADEMRPAELAPSASRVRGSLVGSSTAASV